MMNDYVLFRGSFRKILNEAISANPKRSIEGEETGKKFILNLFRNYYSEKLCLNTLHALRYYLNLKLSETL